MLDAKLVVRDARDDERAWANGIYRSITFATTSASDPQLVVELDGARVGLGRLVALGGGDVELGGIWCDERARGRGVARAVVTELLRRAERVANVWCVPFEHLVAFYEQLGFVRVDAPWHPKVHEKVRACVESALPPVAVLRRR